LSEQAQRFAALEPDLRDLLTDRLARVAAARALSALGVAAGDLVPALVAAIGAGYQGSEALRLLVGLRARAAVADLIRLAGQEGRVQPEKRSASNCGQHRKMQAASRSPHSSNTFRSQHSCCKPPPRKQTASPREPNTP
jgi:hypothetical protein